MGKCLLEYRIPDAAWSLEFCADAIAVLQQHVQKSSLSRESVGQLYTRDLTKPTIMVEVATVLPPVRNSYAHVRFDPKKLATERAALFKQGLHCLGFWHSHPEAVPQPSNEDNELAADHAKAAKGILSGLVFAIVGNAPFPSGLGVWVHDGRAMWTAALEKFETLGYSA